MSKYKLKKIKFEYIFFRSVENATKFITSPKNNI